MWFLFSPGHLELGLDDAWSWGWTTPAAESEHSGVTPGPCSQRKRAGLCPQAGVLPGQLAPCLPRLSCLLGAAQWLSTNLPGAVRDLCPLPAPACHSRFSQDPCWNECVSDLPWDLPTLTPFLSWRPGQEAAADSQLAGLNFSTGAPSPQAQDTAADGFHWSVKLLLLKQLFRTYNCKKQTQDI